MKIYKVKSIERKGRQQVKMVVDCSYHWSKLNNFEYPYYPDIMNMKTYWHNDIHWCYVGVTYHLEPNKW